MEVKGTLISLDWHRNGRRHLVVGTDIIAVHQTVNVEALRHMLHQPVIVTTTGDEAVAVRLDGPAMIEARQQ